jgi:hypothetical protein
MADKKISELDSASLPLAGTEIVPIVQGGVTKKVAVSEIGNDTPFDPSDYDLDEFTNESSDPFVRQSEIPSGTTPDLDAVTQEGNVTKTEIIFAEESEEETTNLIAIGGLGGGDAYLSLRNFLGSNPTAKLLLYFNPLTDLELFLPDLGGNLYSTITVESNITATNYYTYLNASNTNTYTDPTTGGPGSYYLVFVSSDTAIVGGVSYGVGSYLLRYYNGTTWFTRVLNATASPTVEGTTKLYNSLGTGTDGAVNRTVVTEELRRKANNLVLYNRTAWFAQRGSGGFGTIGITVANFVLSGNSSVAPTNTNGYTIQVRTNFATSATAGTLSFYRIGTDATIINTRFIFDGLFGFAGTTADTRFFYGLSTASTATPTNVAPTSLTNILAVSKLDSSNNLHVIHNDASGTATSIDLGANFPCDTNQTDTYYARFEVDTIGTVIYTVCRLNSDGEITHKVDGTITSDLPTDNTLLYHRAWITNNATASVSSFDFMGGSLGKN